MNITDNIRYIGVNDHRVDLFEGQYVVPNGIAYNSYVILDEKVAVVDTVDRHFFHEWLDNLTAQLGGRKPDYLIIHHMEPDHAGNIGRFLEVYPDTTIVSNAKAFAMMEAFFPSVVGCKRLVVADGESLSLGQHTLVFVFAPMVHWPEVMVSYEVTEKVLFSADAFGKFGALDVEEPWDDEARRYYIGIVGKYGKQAMNLLEKAAGLDIAIICPTHGPILRENLGHYIQKYVTWASYAVEEEGIVLAYTSVYGHTEKAAELLAEKLRRNGAPKVVVYDLARCDMAKAVADAFRYSKLVLATTTYNADVFPHMRNFIEHLTERNYQNRTVALIENGSWAPQAAKVMRRMLENSKNLTICDTVVRIKSALDSESSAQLDNLVQELCRDYIALSSEAADKNDMRALFSIGYGLYVVTSHDGQRDNGLIVNTVSQVSDSPNRVAVTINKANYSHHVIKQTGKLNINCLTVEAPFSVFENFGFRSGRNADKFEGITEVRSDNGLRILPQHINAAMSLQVEQYVDLGSHGMFICAVTEARVVSNKETMTYSYYHANVKPKPKTEGKKGYVCQICGWIYEGDELPEDIVCPLCKHGAADFEPIK